MASFEILLYVGAAFLAFQVLRNLLRPGLREIPGPLAAKLSNIYRLVNVRRGDNQVSLVHLHDKYGDCVRFGPNLVSVRNLADVSKIYGLKGGFSKSNFYLVQQQLANGKAMQTIFTTIDEAFHARIKRPVANAYSMTALTSYEPLVDRTITTLLEQLERRFAQTGRDCPIFEWLQFYAFDVIGEITCSETFGFLSQGRDIDAIIESLNTAMDYNAAIGQMPWLDFWLKKNPLWVWVTQPTGAVARFARGRLMSRLAELRGTKLGDGEATKKGDFVDRFLRAREMHPAVVDDTQVFSYMVTNMFAGSDTTAISLRAIVYYTLQHPAVYAKLMSELDGARASGQLSIPTRWRESQELVYFDCVVKEALRLHPAVGLVLERVVPSQGLQLECGTTLPAGTIVGASPWVMHRSKAIFGHDADAFRPERWLAGDNENPVSYDARLKAMVGATMTFGKGHRTCIGKNISLLEIYKMLPTLFLTYHLTLAMPEKRWKLRNSWFVRQEGIEVRLKKRCIY